MKRVIKPSKKKPVVVKPVVDVKPPPVFVPMAKKSSGTGYYLTVIFVLLVTTLTIYLASLQP